MLCDNQKNIRTKRISKRHFKIKDLDVNKLLIDTSNVTTSKTRFCGLKECHKNNLESKM